MLPTQHHRDVLRNKWDWWLFEISHTAGDCGEKDENETKEREEVCELSWFVQGNFEGFSFSIYDNVIKNSLRTWTQMELWAFQPLLICQKSAMLLSCSLCLFWWILGLAFFFLFLLVPAMLEGFRGSEFPQAHFEHKVCNREELLFRPPFSLSVTQLIPLAA